MSTIDVLNAEGAIVPVELPLVPGRAVAATSRPVALSNEDKAALDLLHTDLGAVATAANQTSANTKLDTLHTDLSVVGRAAAVSSRPVVLSTEDKAALDLIHTDLSTSTVAQNSTTAGQTGPLVQGAVTTAAPTYTTAKTAPLSLDAQGSLRVNVVSGGAGGGAVTIADGASVTLGSKADAKSTATDTTPITAMSIWKQISASMQALVAGLSSPGPALPAGSTAVCDSGSGIVGSTWGVAAVPFTSADAHNAAASVTDAPTSTQHLVIDDIIFSTDTDMTVTFKEETSGTVVFGPWYCTAKAGPIQITPRGKKKLATVDKKLQVITSVAGNITVSASYHSEA